MSKRALIVVFFVLLFGLHQDFWLRDNSKLVFGFLPASLAYHVGWTLLVSFGWFLVGKYCWPERLEEEAPRRRSGTGGADGEHPAR